MALSVEEFSFVQELVRQRSAIILAPGKEYLVETRLIPVANQAGCRTVGELIRRLRGPADPGLHQQVIDAMTTNETTFFRDRSPFEIMRTRLLPQVFQRRASDRSVNIWCGASSTGQEPYSIAMIIREHFPTAQSWNIRIIASDIARNVLDRAKAATYSQIEVNRGLPANFLVKYFRPVGAEWKLRDDIRSMVDFRLINLAEAWPQLPPMDIVFLRNVLIYFDTETKRAILGKVRRQLRGDGYLFLGNAETTLNLDAGFERVPWEGSGCYRLRGSALGA